MKWKLQKRWSDIRSDGLIEALCDHGVGHHRGIHGCDGCCRDWPEEVAQETTKDQTLKPAKRKPTPKVVKKVVKKPTVSSLKKKAWTLFSLYIRLKYTDWRGWNACVTCGVVKHYKQMQAGHFIPGRRNLILFDERGVHPQCYRCNIELKSNPRKYQAFMERTYGLEVIAELDRLEDMDKQFTPTELEDLIKDLKEKIKCLPNSQNLRKKKDTQLSIKMKTNKMCTFPKTVQSFPTQKHSGQRVTTQTKENKAGEPLVQVQFPYALDTDLSFESQNARVSYLNGTNPHQHEYTRLHSNA